MYVSRMALTDFRSYEGVDLSFEPGLVAFVGPNGRGKTNLVEAINYIATLSSHRVAHDGALIRAGAKQAVIKTRITRSDGSSERHQVVELAIIDGKANQARINRSQTTRPRDVLGALRTVLFAPEDLGLVKGEPEGRRRFLDELLIAMQPRLAGIRADYDRVLRQRSTLLKSAGAARRQRAQPDLRTLDVWDGHLAQAGAEILDARIRTLRSLAPHVATAYEQVSSAQSDATIAYKSSLGEDFLALEQLPTRDDYGQLLQEALKSVRAQEIDRGVCLVGPHRDDLILSLGSLPAKGYASHGESWSLALAMRLATYRLQVEEEFAVSTFGEDNEPVLILDDVFAELDTRRRQRLAELVAPARQVFVTAAVPTDVPEQLIGARFHVDDGAVERVA